jgi:hypothetical protein
MELQKLFTESKNIDPVSRTVVSKLRPMRAFSRVCIGKSPKMKPKNQMATRFFRFWVAKMLQNWFWGQIL